MGSILSLQVPITWPEAQSNVSGITLLDNLKEARHWKTVELPKDIAFYLKLRNKLHFGQAHSTPFTIPPSSVEVDWVENSMTPELVLKGEHSNSELSFLQTLLLTHCKSKQTKATVGEPIDLSKWKDKIQVWKERMTMSPSGKHLGHYKAVLARGPDDLKSEEGRVFQSQQDSLVQVGGCAGCDTNALTLMEVLKTDISRCSRKVLINFDNNAALFYNQIIPNLAKLIGRKKGLHHNITFVHEKCSQKQNIN
eukprot:15354296-Ditylum_brightwellii.AAC.1